MNQSLAAFAGGALFGIVLCGWPWHPRFSRYKRRICPPKGSYGLPADHDWSRSFNHENTSRQPSPPEYRWKEWPEDCPECGGPLEVFTTYIEDGWAGDGDTVRCVDSDCKTAGHISVDTEKGAYAMFPDRE